MRIQLAAWSVFLAASCMTSVALSDDTTTTQAKPTIGAQIDSAIASIKKFSATQKDDALKQGRVALDALDERIDKLERQLKKDARKMDESARMAADKSLRALREQRAELAKHYDDIARSSAAAWDDAKTTFVQGYESLRESIERAQKNMAESP